MSYESAMTAPLTAEQAREQLTREIEKLYRCEPLIPAITQLMEWQAVNIGRNRISAHINDAQYEMMDAATRMQAALALLTREPQARPSLWERLRTWAIGRPEQ